jgi:tyrosinase
MESNAQTKDALPPQRTRYQHVQQILNAAAGASTATYQGYGKPWSLPLADFLQVTLYGVRLIAPPPEKASGLAPAVGLATLPGAAPSAPGSCCGGSSAAPVMAVSQLTEPSSLRRHPGRGAASGLIIGLKGLAPFDGGQFPRLPWGGTSVPVSEIQLIEDWIDDGCPDEVESIITIKESPLVAIHNGDAECPRCQRPTNDFHEAGGALKKRKNVRYMDTEELRRLRAAIAKMHSFDAYPQDERSFGYWARTHANLCQHGWEEFLTWHRLYLYFFELQMQDFDNSVTLPYWDWTLDDQNWEAATIDSGCIPEAYQCWIDQPALDGLKGKIPEDTWQKLSDRKGKKYNSGLRFFADLPSIPYVPFLDPTTLKPADANSTTVLIMTALQQVNPLWYRLRWPGPGNQQGLMFEAYPTPGDINQLLQIGNFFAFGSGSTNDHFFGALENVHNAMHNFSGGANPTVVTNPAYQNNANYDPQNRFEPQFGDMVNAGVTAFDPIFWGHHSNVDRLWAQWQTLHPNVDPDDLPSTLPPWPMTVGDALNISNLGYEYVKSEHLFETNSTRAFTRFKSAKAGVPSPVLRNHRRAEIRLLRVKYSLQGGCFVRAFLNQPDANVDTPISNNDSYVGQMSLFSGSCIGGPGHCEPPVGPRRKFDRRHRHKKTPGNIHFDATDAVRCLVAKGATDLQVHLVVFDLEGKPPQTDALTMGAVSLVFLD